VSRPLLVWIPAYEELARRLLALSDAEAVTVERRTFPDGERYQRLETDVRDRHVVLLAGTATDEDTVSAYDLASAVSLYGAARLTWLCPYFGYQTMERAVKPGEVVAAKTRARLISSVHGAGNRIVLLDLHADGIPHYFEDDWKAFHVYAKELAIESARAFARESEGRSPSRGPGGEATESSGPDFVLAATDAGSAKWVQSLANEMGVEAAFVYKRRVSGEKTEVTGVNASVEGRTVVIYDDMIRTGGSLVEAARAYRSKGALKVFAVTTHLVLPGDALARIRASGAIDGIAGTDSHTRARGLEGVTVRTVAPLLSKWLV
jgi:ribose-phosphate pyrophosphokinase